MGGGFDRNSDILIPTSELLDEALAVATKGRPGQNVVERCERAKPKCGQCRLQFQFCFDLAFRFALLHNKENVRVTIHEMSPLFWGEIV